MTGDWSIERLGTLCEIRTGRKDVNQGNPNGEFPFFTCAKEHTFSDVYSFEGEALLIAGNGDVGNVSYYNGKFEAYQRTYVLMGFQRVLPSYLFRVLEGTLKPALYDQKLGNTMPYIKKGMLTEFPVPLPPLSEQKRIAAILNEVFTGLDQAVTNAEKNLANARELFESYLKSVFAPNGAGWTETTVSESCTLQSGTSVNKSLEQPTGAVPYVKVADMTFDGNETQIVGSSRFLAAKDAPSRNIFPVGTTIFPKRGGAILTNKKRITAVPICADLNIMGVIPSERIDPEFLYFYFLGINMAELGSGSAIPQINNYDIGPLPICFPTDRQEQRMLVNLLQDLSAQTQRLETTYKAKAKSLAELRQSILHRAFAGELTARSEESPREATA